MRISVTCLAVTLCVNTVGVANAAYVIKLKNGNEYVTNRYWQEGAQVLFDAEGGVFGIDKAFVNKIEKTDKVIKMVTTADHDPSENRQAVANENSKEPAKEAPAAEANRPGKDDNDPIMKEFNALKALSQNLDSLLTSEMIDLSNRLTALKKKLQLEGKTNDYLREFGAIHDIGAAVEDALKTRR